MIKTKEFFALLQLVVVPGEMLQRDVTYEKMGDDRLCKDDNCLFEIPMDSLVFCSIVCRTNDFCHGFFFNNMKKQCTGSNATLIYRDTFGNLVGSSFYQEGSSGNKNSHTKGQTTELLKPSTEDDSQNKIETSTSQHSQQISTSWKTSQSKSSRQTSMLLTEQQSTSGEPFVHEMWTTRNTSAYSLVFNLSFSKAFMKCRILGAGSGAVRIEDIQENDFLQNLLIIKDLDAAFIGYMWDTKTMTLRYFDNGEPAEFDDPWFDDGSSERPCVTLDSRGRWQSLSCEEIFPIICEKPVL